MLATEFLRRHHDELRALVSDVSMSPAERLQVVLHKLAAEMSLHEQIEDEIFYPAMRDISTLVTIAHAEHREMDDQVVTVLRVADDEARFAEEFKALVDAFEHHAGLEETRMFREIEDKLTPDYLTDVGARLDRRLDQLRSSAISRTRLRMKFALIRRL